jgi:hypothetical protein
MGFISVCLDIDDAWQRNTSMGRRGIHTVRWIGSTDTAPSGPEAAIFGGCFAASPLTPRSVTRAPAMPSPLAESMILVSNPTASVCVTGMHPQSASARKPVPAADSIAFRLSLIIEFPNCIFLKWPSDSQTGAAVIYLQHSSSNQPIEATARNCTIMVPLKRA